MYAAVNFIKAQQWNEIDRANSAVKFWNCFKL